jgi:hypothetical protein
MSDFQYQEWLRLLRQARKGPVTLPVCVRGQEYRHTIEIEGDWTTGTLASEIKVAPNADTPLATFAIGNVSFDGTYTSFECFLSASETLALPALPEGVDNFLYDFLLNGERLIGGLFPVSGFITDTGATPTPPPIPPSGDAPEDGEIYGRQDGEWVIVPAFTEAPIDGEQYVRKDGDWELIEFPLTQEWAPNFTADGSVYIPADEAMTISQGNAAIGTGTLTYEKSTNAAPGTFASTTLPATLEAGAWLRVIATGVSGFRATHLVRTA